MDHAKRAAGVAVVTGAAGGMGGTAARLMAAEGWPLLLCDLEPDRLDAVAAPLRAQGAQVEVLADDVADLGFPGRLAAALGERPVAAVIHAAGLSPTMASAERILEVNLDATVRLVEVIRSRMSEGAAAVLIASMAGHMPISPLADAAFDAPPPAAGAKTLLKFATSPQVAYPLSKRGVISLVAREAGAFGKRGARIVSISPGLIDTRMTRAEVTEGSPSQALIDRAALPRLGRPEEVMAMAVFLCSPAASFVTGCDIQVDGGALAAIGL